MKILGVCGSPRNQTTEYTLKMALNHFKEEEFETTLYSIRGKQISPCQHCDYCIEHKQCIMKNDMTEVYEYLKEADGIILATPVQSGGCSSQLSAIMDRTRALEAIDYNILRGKIGMGIAVGGDRTITMYNNNKRMGIAVGGDRTEGQDFALLKIITYYMIHGIIPVSRGPFGSNLGASFWSQDSMKGIENDKYGQESLNRTVVEFKKFLKKYI